LSSKGCHQYPADALANPRKRAVRIAVARVFDFKAGLLAVG